MGISSCLQQGWWRWTLLTVFVSGFVLQVILTRCCRDAHFNYLASLATTVRGRETANPAAFQVPVNPCPKPCPNVLSWAVRGKWVPRNHTKEDLGKIMTFFNKTRGYHKIPASLQRADKKCGNIAVGKTKMHPYRALCDPAGSTPCCYSNHKCVARSKEQCVCDGCMDVRQPVHAELSDWVPANYGCHCQLKNYFNETDMCPVLHNTTVHFMGDSYIRQMYIAFLALLRTGHADGVFAHTNTSRKTVSMCDPYFVYFRKCKLLIPRNVTSCNDSTQVRLTHTLTLKQHAQGVLDQAKSYMGQPNTFLVLWIGAWERFDVDKVGKGLLTPLLDLLTNSPWPRVIWASAHSPGLLKPPIYKQGRAQNVMAFNKGVEKIFKGEFPILDFFYLTEKNGVQSYDGSHYGPGVNTLKAQVLLNYLAELRRDGVMSHPTPSLNDTSI